MIDDLCVPIREIGTHGGWLWVGVGGGCLKKNYYSYYREKGSVMKSDSPDQTEMSLLC